MSYVFEIEVLEIDRTTILIEIAFDHGKLQVVADWALEGRNLVLQGVHIQGMLPGALGRPGLNAMAQKIMEEADVDTVEIYGAIRTTGRNPGRPPRRFFARRHPRPEA